jgi:hypothetical protein
MALLLMDQKREPFSKLAELRTASSVVPICKWLWQFKIPNKQNRGYIVGVNVTLQYHDTTRPMPFHRPGPSSDLVTSGHVMGSRANDVPTNQRTSADPPFNSTNHRLAFQVSYKNQNSFSSRKKVVQLEELDLKRQ